MMTLLMIYDKVVLIENFSFFLIKCNKNFSLKIENKKLFKLFDVLLKVCYIGTTQ